MISTRLSVATPVSALHSVLGRHAQNGIEPQRTKHPDAALKTGMEVATLL